MDTDSAKRYSSTSDDQVGGLTATNQTTFTWVSFDTSQLGEHACLIRVAEG